jgi:hypothetical protein
MSWSLLKIVPEDTLSPRARVPVPNGERGCAVVAQKALDRHLDAEYSK